MRAVQHLKGSLMSRNALWTTRGVRHGLDHDVSRGQLYGLPVVNFLILGSALL